MPDATDSLWVGSMPEAYERWLATAVFQPFAVDLAARVAAHQPHAVLELAAGTGVLTRELLRAAGVGAVTATDRNDAMVDFGRERAPGATWQQADATHLPYDDAQFDVVVCQFSVMFFPNRPAAYAEARRVLSPSGRLVFNTWDVVGRHDFQAAMTAALEHIFPIDPPTFLVAVPHACADVDNVCVELRAGGFDAITADTVTLEGHAASTADIAAGYCTGTPLRAAIEARGDLPETTELVARELTARLGSGAVTGRMSAHVFEATPA